MSIVQVIFSIVFFVIILLIKIFLFQNYFPYFFIPFSVFWIILIFIAKLHQAVTVSVGLFFFVIATLLLVFGNKQASGDASEVTYIFLWIGVFQVILKEPFNKRFFKLSSNKNKSKKQHR